MFSSSQYSVTKTYKGTEEQPGLVTLITGSPHPQGKPHLFAINGRKC